MLASSAAIVKPFLAAESGSFLVCHMRGASGQVITFVYSQNLVTFFRPFLISPLSQQIEKDLSVGRERALFVVDDIAVAFHVKIRDTELLERAARESFFHCVFVQESHSQFLVDSALDRFRRVAAQDNVRSVSLVSEL